MTTLANRHERPDLRPGVDFYRPRRVCTGSYRSAGADRPCGLAASHEGEHGPALTWAEYRSHGRSPIHAEGCRVGGCAGYCACFCHHAPEES